MYFVFMSKSKAYNTINYKKRKMYEHKRSEDLGICYLKVFTLQVKQYNCV